MCDVEEGFLGLEQNGWGFPSALVNFLLPSSSSPGSGSSLERCCLAGVEALTGEASSWQAFAFAICAFKLFLFRLGLAGDWQGLRVIQCCNLLPLGSHWNTLGPVAMCNTRCVPSVGMYVGRARGFLSPSWCSGCSVYWVVLTVPSIFFHCFSSHSFSLPPPLQPQLRLVSFSRRRATMETG